MGSSELFSWGSSLYYRIDSFSEIQSQFCSRHYNCNIAFLSKDNTPPNEQNPFLNIRGAYLYTVYEFFNLKFHSFIGASHNLYLRSVFIDGIKSFHIKADKYKRIFLVLLNSYILLEHPQ